MRRDATARDGAMTPALSSSRVRADKAPALRELALRCDVDRARHVLGRDRVEQVASRVLLANSSLTTHDKEHPMLIATSSDCTNVSAFESIDAIALFGVLGGQGQQPARPQQQPAPQPPQPNFMQRWGRNMQTGGEYAMAAGAAGTVVPVLGETGIPEGVAAGGGASWLLGKGIEGIGSLFNR